MYKKFLLVLFALILARPAIGAELDQREHDLIRAAAIYTAISFSKSNREARRKVLPLSEEEFQQLDVLLPPRFQACMEGGFALAFPEAEQAQILRRLMESVIVKNIAEPANSNQVIAGFQAANQWCSARIPLWTSAILH